MASQKADSLLHPSVQRTLAEVEKGMTRKNGNDRYAYTPTG